MRLKIKFWDTERKIMLESNVSCITAFRNYLDVAAETRFSDCNNQPEKNRYIPLLFSGMKDKNKKELWDGDLVLFDTEMFYGEVVVNKFIKCKVVFEGKDASFNIVPLELSDFEGYPLFALNENIEKIGNIYENTKL